MYNLRLEGWITHTKISRLYKSKLDSQKGQSAKAPITMVTNYLSVLRNGYQTHFEPDLPAIREALRNDWLFHSP